MTKSIKNAKQARNEKRQRTIAAQRQVANSSAPRRVVNLGTLFPDRIMTNMRYCDVITRAPALSVVDQYNFNLNSTFDPDSTGAGHQPMGRDQVLGTLYNKYRVHSVDVKVQFQAVGGVGFQSLLFFAVPSNDASAITGQLGLAMEQPYSWNCFYGGATVNPLNVFRKRFNLWDIWGKTREQYLADDITAAQYNASPVEVILLKLGAMTADATQLVVWQFAIEMNMHVECYDRFTQSQS